MPYVYSTLTCDNAFAFYVQQGNDLPIIEKTILIRGGANLANKFLITPKGTATQVSDEELELLEKDYHFKDHVKNGFITVEKREVSIDKIVQDMKDKDRSAPGTPDDYKESDDLGPNGSKIYKRKNK